MNSLSRLHRGQRRLLSDEWHQPFEGDHPIGDHESRQWLAIECFKERDKRCQVAHPAKVFQSSGTLGHQSQVGFSQQGLTAYDQIAFKTFRAVLSCFVANPDVMVGYSLIPNTRTWPHSSLAHMIESFATKVPVHYDVDLAAKDWQDHPAVWVFGTAFHFVHGLDRGIKTVLPPGSLVFETGGTKNQSRSISREDLYQGVSEMFGIPTRQIISEYGMCELAAQAYDWVDPCDPDQPRRFRFPHWIDLWVDQGLGIVTKNGKGALCVYDPYRPDLTMGVRTQDLVCLGDDGRFELLGRVPSQLIKGCSLLVEDITAPAGAVTLPPPNAAIERPWSRLTLQEDTMLDRAKTIAAMLQNYAWSPALAQRLRQEFNSPLAEQHALKEILEPLTLTPQQWCRLALASIGSRRHPLEHWFVVLPGNHSLAGYQCLVLGAIVGLTMKIRLPKALEGSFIEGLIQNLQELYPNAIARIPSTFRIDSSSALPGGILCFGHDQTIDHLRLVLNNPVIGFGSVQAATIAEPQDLLDSCDELLASAFQLNQRGCLSSRAIFFDRSSCNGWNSDRLEKILAHFSRASQSWCPKDRSFAMNMALDQEYQRYQRQSSNILAPRNHHSQAVFAVIPEFSPSWLSHIPFVLPIFAKIPAPEILASHFRQIYGSPSTNLPLTTHRSPWGQPLPWTGQHLGQAFYSPGNEPPKDLICSK